MSKVWKTVLSIAALAVLLGVIVCAVGLLLGGGFVNNEQFEKFTETFSADISEIKTDLNVADLLICQVDGDEIVFTYHDNEKQYYSFDLSGGVLSIERSRRMKWYDYIKIGFFNTVGDDAEIGIPKNFEGSLTLKTSTGDIEISGLDLKGGVSVTLSTGDVTLRNITCAGDMSLSLTTGDVSASALEIGGDFTVKTTTGDQKYGDVNCAGDLSLKSTTGDVRIKGANASSLLIRGSVGDAVISSLDASRSIYIELTTGSVKCDLPDGMENYTIKSRASTGSNSLPSQGGNGPKRLEVYTTTGDIRVGFKK